MLTLCRTDSPTAGIIKLRIVSPTDPAPAPCLTLMTCEYPMTSIIPTPIAPTQAPKTAPMLAKTSKTRQTSVLGVARDVDILRNRIAVPSGQVNRAAPRSPVSIVDVGENPRTPSMPAKAS